MFPFIDMAVLFFRKRLFFHAHRVVPLPVLASSVVVGTLVCGTTIISTLLNSFIPTLLPNSTWMIFVGIITLTWLTICAVGSMLTSGQAGWEQIAQMEKL